MSILNQQFFQMSNAIFCYGLKPIQLAVYSYLRCCAGKKETCFPRMKTIAASCSCSESAAWEAIRELERRGFIYTQPCYRSRNGLIRQTSNTYYSRTSPNQRRRTPSSGERSEVLGRNYDKQDKEQASIRRPFGHKRPQCGRFPGVVAGVIFREEKESWRQISGKPQV